MKNRWLVLLILTALIAALNSVVEAVYTVDIDKVRRKEVLGSADFEIIETFVAEAVGALVNTDDFSCVSKNRTALIQRSNSNEDSAQGQYADRFFASAHKYISSGLKQASAFESEERKFKVVLNLLILINDLENIRLAELAVGKLRDASPVIRYWAVNCVTNDGIVRQLNSEQGANPQFAAKILRLLKESVNNSSPEETALIAEFAAKVDIEQSEALLGLIADIRINRYADWTVENELMDAGILKNLFVKMSASGSGKDQCAHRFGQLYSYVFQRYAKGADYLGKEQKRLLGSVLVETERMLCMNGILRPRSIIKKAVSREDYTAIMAEHDKILGGAGGRGEIAVKLKFNYGSNADGSERTEPLELAEPPQKETGK